MSDTSNKKPPQSADFETLTKAPTRVWLWGSCTIGNESEFVYGTKIEDFIIFALKQDVIYFQNEIWDATFILDYLLQHDWYECKKRKHKTFSMVMSAGGQLYSLHLTCKNHTVHIYDAYKKFRMSAERLSAAFKMDVKKGDTPLYETLPEDYEPTPDEIDYVKHDCQIVAIALQTQLENNLKKLTIGSDALAYYKKTEPQFNNLFPQIGLDIDDAIRESYRGGWSHLKENEGYPKEHGPGIILDYNSLYPSIQFEKTLPYGAPVLFEGQYQYDAMYPLYVARCVIDFKIKDSHLPFIQIKRSLRFIDTEHITDSKGPVELTLTSVDIELLHDQYNVYEFKMLWGFKFKATRGLFDDYIEHFNALKAQATIDKNDAERTIWKLMLNNLYGKFGKNPDVTGRHVEYDWVTRTVKYVKNQQEVGKPLYIPMASFITAWARDKEVRGAQKLYKWFRYGDTDSYHLTGCTIDDVKNIVELDPVKLGKMDYEASFTRARYLHSKCYIESIIKKDGTTQDKITCAGLSVARATVGVYDNNGDIQDSGIKAGWDNFIPGTVYTNNTKSKIVEGGVILENCPFELK